jgi:hypothetical protein
VLFAAVSAGVLMAGGPAGLWSPAWADTTVGVSAVVITGHGASVITRQVATGQVGAVTRQLASRPGVVSVSADTPVRAVGSPDPFRSQQWALDSFHLDELPAGTPDGSGEIVAVLDTGVDAAHEDLAGVVRCDLGADFASDQASADPAGDGCSDPNGHGTHVTGEIAANSNNSTGIEGASAARIMPVRVLDADGSGSSSSVVSGILYAVDHGADVINMSLAGPYNSAYDTAVSYAVTHDVPVVVAAGNNRQSGNVVNYPAASPGALAVAAVDSNNDSAGFSYSGPTNLISAPGVSILSTDSLYGYRSRSGTSMASPFVAAIVARYLQGHGSATVPSVRAAIQATAIDIGAAGFDDDTGYGLINPYALLTGADYASPPAAPTGLTATPAPGQVALTWVAETGVDSYTVYRDGAAIATPTAAAYTDTPPGGSHTYAVAAVASGVESPLSATVLAAPDLVAGPTHVRVALVTGHSPTVSWSPVAGAESYRVYRNGIQAVSTSRTTWTDASVTVSPDEVTGASLPTYSVASVVGGEESAQVSAAGYTPDPHSEPNPDRQAAFPRPAPPRAPVRAWGPETPVSIAAAAPAAPTPVEPPAPQVADSPAHAVTAATHPGGGLPRYWIEAIAAALALGSLAAVARAGRARR